MKNKQTNGPKNHAKQMQRNNYKIARPCSERVSVPGHGRNCCARDLTGSALLDY